MSALLPDRVRPAELADARRRVAGKVPATRLQRLADRLSSTRGALQVTLAFTRREAAGDARRGIEVHGRIAGTLCLACQRCLGPLPREVDIEVALGVVADPSEVPAGDVEPWVVSGEHGSLVELVEEEVILELPMHPMHAPGACAPQAPRAGGSGPPQIRTRPFAGLAELLAKADVQAAPGGSDAAERPRRKRD